jgi:hypothetical protein
MKHKFPQCEPANLETSRLLEIGDISAILQLRCGCQFPWCALGLTVLSDRMPSEHGVDSHNKIDFINITHVRLKHL